MIRFTFMLKQALNSDKGGVNTFNLKFTVAHFVPSIPNRIDFPFGSLQKKINEDQIKALLIGGLGSHDPIFTNLKIKYGGNFYFHIIHNVTINYNNISWNLLNSIHIVLVT